MGNYLGQHFLKNKSALEKIAIALNILKNETVIEIGPGHGELTDELMANSKWLMENGKLILIEKDDTLASSLKEKFSDNKQIEIINGDALEELTKITSNKQLAINNYKIVGNIPYYITGHLLRTIGELKNKPKITVLTIQKEVAERICAKKPKMNLLAAATQFWSEPKILFLLKQDDFDPPPDVESAVIELATKQLTTNNKKTEDYYKIIHVIFKQPRKTIFNNLRSGLQLSEEKIKNALLGIKISPTARAQDLSLNQLEELAELLT
ncbi:MAG: 16S rRNA (adenine(1518)-N(6)/adenine(1519)-N(6))-dimethyltransferase RsmA [Candidatus Pacebacteria bacterium]|nr:16S rRNA (adenine(1518)-N(6)/adenine(1519)-N(6))-dimethyltransferase RsmA [Candidatus Paceibacterota bacterium]